jgi:DNA-binding CsgD family transcriptional regulator
MANSGESWRFAPPGQDPARPRRALPGDVPVAVRAGPRTVGVSPAQLATLRTLGKRVTSAISPRMTRAVNWPTPGRAVSALTRGFCLGIVTQLVIEPVSHGRQNVDERRAVGDDLPGHRRQVQFSQPAAAVPGPAAAGLVVAEMVAAARTSREVAGAPVISVKTVDSSLSRIYRKPGVRSGTELARKLPAKNDPAPAC